MSSTITTLDGAEFEPRDLRAATEDIEIEKEAPGMYEARGKYMLDIVEGVCWCPDHEYRNNHCKHLRKAEMIEGDREIPPVPGLDEDLREKLEEAVRADEGDEADEKVSITDGGVTSAGPHIPSEESSDLGADADAEISLRSIVAEQTSTIEDLTDFGYDQPPGCNGEPYSTIVRFAYETVERLTEAETNAEPTT